MLTSEYLRYPADAHVPEYLLDSLQPDTVTEQDAYNALSLLTKAYEAHFENPESYPLPLEPGTVRAHFDPENDDNVTSHFERMKAYMGKGASFLYIHQVGGRPELTDNGAMAGLVKVSPSQSRVSRLLGHDPNLFVNDVLVHPDLQQTTSRIGKAAGATLLHGALGHAGFSPDSLVALHAFEGDATTDWYRRLGLRAVRQVDAVEVGGEQLPQVLYASKRGTTVGSVLRKLETRHPQLALGSLIPKEMPVEPFES